MQRAVNGMHVPNMQQWFIEQMLRVAKQSGAVTILDFLMFPSSPIANDQSGDHENDYWYWKLRHGWPPQGIPAAPERFIHIRAYQANWADWDGAEVARRVVPHYANWRSTDRDGQPVRGANLWDDPLVGISPCNEQNLEGPATNWWGLTPDQRSALLEQWATWQLRFWDEVDRLLPNRKAVSVLGALAYGGDWWPDVPDSEYQHPRWRELCQRVDVLATHPYGHLDWGDEKGRATVDPARDAYWHILRDFRPEGWRDAREPGKPHDIGGILAQYPGKPLLITECGTFTHADPHRTAETAGALRLLYERAAASGRVIGCTPFIWNSDASHPTNRIVPNEGLRAALEAFPDYYTTATVPRRGQGGTPMPVQIACDVSEYQGEVDFLKMKAAGAVAVWIRAGGGVGLANYRGQVDKRFEENVRGAERAGLPWGPYWWFANTLEGAPQAEAFAARLRDAGVRWSLPPAADWEHKTTRVKAEWCLAAMEAIEALIGLPLFYTSPSWLEEQAMEGQQWLRNYPLWLARYTSAPTVPAPPPWNELGYALWQYSAGGNSMGARYGADSRDIDLNRLYMPLEALMDLVRTPAPPEEDINVDALLRAARRAHLEGGIRINPQAALFKYAAARNLVPVTNEMSFGDQRVPFLVAESLEERGARALWWYKGQVYEKPVPED